MENMLEILFLDDSQKVTDEINANLTKEQKRLDDEHMDRYNNLFKSLNGEQKKLFNDIENYRIDEETEHSSRLYYLALKRGIALGIDIGKTKF